MPTPKPLSLAQRRTFQALLVVGILVLGLGLYLSSTDAATLIVGAALGGGSSLIAMSLMQLYYRPDR